MALITEYLPAVASADATADATCRINIGDCPPLARGGTPLEHREVILESQIWKRTNWLISGQISII